MPRANAKEPALWAGLEVIPLQANVARAALQVSHRPPMGRPAENPERQRPYEKETAIARLGKATPARAIDCSLLGVQKKEHPFPFSDHGKSPGSR